MENRPPRLRFDEVQKLINEQQGYTEVIVKLSFAKQVFQGRAQGLHGSENELQLAASAALQAIELFIEQRFSCRLLELDQVKAIGNTMIVLMVDICYEHQTLQIFGSCRANKEESLLETAARAALDATNRYVELILINKDQANEILNRIRPSADIPC